MPFEICDKCKRYIAICRCDTELVTPPKGEPMPRTIPYYIKRGEMDQELILKMAKEISYLTARNNKLEKKLLRREARSGNCNSKERT